MRDSAIRGSAHLSCPLPTFGLVYVRADLARRRARRGLLQDPPLVIRREPAAFRLRLNFRAARLYRDCHRTFPDRPLQRTRTPAVSHARWHGGFRRDRAKPAHERQQLGVLCNARVEARLPELGRKVRTASPPGHSRTCSCCAMQKIRNRGPHEGSPGPEVVTARICSEPRPACPAAPSATRSPSASRSWSWRSRSASRVL